MYSKTHKGMIQSINPYTQNLIAIHPSLNSEQLSGEIEKSAKSFQIWKKLSYKERSVLFLKMAELLRKNKEKHALLISTEVGKIIRESRAEIEKCAWLCEYYAEHTEKILMNESIVSDASKSFVRFEPMGIIYAIMPWNFPFWQVLRAALPTIMAGNTMLLKHAPNVIGCATTIENLFIDSGFPEHVFKSLIIPIELSEQVIAHPAVCGVSLTGSLQAGSEVASQAGKYLKKSIMELGGSDPFIVLKDADISLACKTGLASRMLNAGQVCISAKRFIVEESIYDQFVEEHKKLLQKLKLGDPLSEDTDMGPMAREDLLISIENQVNKSVEMGAKIIIGGKRLNSKDWFYEPTIITNVTNNMPVFREETFGPVSVIIKVKDANDAIKIANDSSMGLGASLWTNKPEIAEKMASQIEAGAVFINGMTKSDPRIPFGGIKQSGYGRELGAYGIKEFVNIKSVWIK